MMVYESQSIDLMVVRFQSIDVDGNPNRNRLIFARRRRKFWDFLGYITDNSFIYRADPFDNRLKSMITSYRSPNCHRLIDGFVNPDRLIDGSTKLNRLIDDFVNMDRLIDGFVNVDRLM